ncbi:MAG: hypothetical protein B7Z80_02660 [Rhodospirillales bacterium 20-64-7]|nr:MAG: hypothetical protein B7Z80_02660 [Rhodospirillales bacterium 20-64-7]
MIENMARTIRVTPARLSLTIVLPATRCKKIWKYSHSSKHKIVKLCTKCRISPQHTYGTWCKDCWSQVSKDRWASKTDEERELIRKGQRLWYSSNKLSVQKRKIEQKYGLTEEQFNRKLEKQNFICEICKTTPDKFYVDHNHDTGKVRGLICHHCNIILGMSKDQIEVLRSAARYLKRYDES